MSLKVMGKKRGMSQLFDEKGNVTVVTVIEAEPNVVTQIKTVSSDGYCAVQTGFEEVKVKDPRTMDKRVTRPLRGHFHKATVAPRKYLTESRVESVSGYTMGQEIGVSLFADIPFVDVTAVSKGKGFQGVMKLHRFSGGPAAHGSGFHRHAGSTGMRSSPGRCFPGGPRASHMGLERKTVQNLKVVKIDLENNVILVKGQVPGPSNGLVYLSQAKKKTGLKKKSR